MKRDAFLKLVAERNVQRMRLLEQKGAAYSPDSDAFANFKRNAEKLGLSAFQVWAVYCGKHLDAIFGAIRKNPLRPVDYSEGMHGRIDDAKNYLELLQGMLDEAPIDNTDGVLADGVYTTEQVADKIINLLGGNGLSTVQQRELVIHLLKEMYGPRHFAL